MATARIGVVTRVVRNVVFQKPCRKSFAITPDFTHRAVLAQNPEWMDQPCSYDELRECLRGIAGINRLTLGYRPTMKWLDYVYSVMPRQRRPVHIVDVGCGYGDFLRRIHRWAQDRHVPVKLTGIDLNPGAVQAARAATPPDWVTYLSGNVFDFNPPEGIDLVVSSLVMHHLEDREIVDMLDWMESKARLGWFINDLHRQAVPYHAFRLAAKVMPWHPFVKHDGPVSIQRSFRVQDWERLLKAAAIPVGGYQLQEYRPGRLCVARWK